METDTTPRGLIDTGAGTSAPTAGFSLLPSLHRLGSVRLLSLDAHGRVLDWINWQDAACLYARGAVAFIHPADLPGPVVDGVPPFAADFLLDTTRAAYLLVRNGIRRRYPNIRFILSHAGGFVPYAAHRMAVAIMGETGRSPADTLDGVQGLC